MPLKRLTSKRMGVKGKTSQPTWEVKNNSTQVLPERRVSLRSRALLRAPIHTKNFIQHE